MTCWPFCRGYSDDPKLRRADAVRRLAQADAVPIVEGQIACATAVATFLLAADVDDPSCTGLLRRVGAPELPLGREDVIARLRRRARVQAGAGASPRERTASPATSARSEATKRCSSGRLSGASRADFISASFAPSAYGRPQLSSSAVAPT